MSLLGENMEISSAKLLKLVKQSENFKLEFKKCGNELPKSFWETYSAFCNTDGGLVILGIAEENGENVIKGVKNSQKIITDLWNQLSNKNKVSYNAISNSDVQLSLIPELNVEIIIIKVDEAPVDEKPVFLKNDLRDTYIRKGDGDYKATNNEIKAMLRNASSHSDMSIVNNYTFNDLDINSVISFKEKVAARYPEKKYTDLSTIDFLKSIGIIKTNKLTNEVQITKAALLFLGKYNAIREIFPSYHLDYINKKDAVNRWLDRLVSDEPNEVEINIYNFYYMVYEKLRGLIFDSFKLDENGVAIKTSGTDIVFREALVNMLAHADYEMEGRSLRIEVNNAWCKFKNPGKMLVRKAQFFKGGESLPRNQGIMTMFRLLGLSERYGFGGSEIYKYAVENDYRIPSVNSTYEYTELIIWQVDLIDSYPELSDKEREIFNYIIKSREGLSKQKLKKMSNLSDHYIRKILNKLIDEDKVEVSGKGPSTKYILKRSSIEALANIQLLLNDLMKKR